jgi:hypothetical protein
METSMLKWFRSRAHELKQASLLSLGLTLVGVVALAPDGGIVDMTWDVLSQILAGSVGAVVLVHLMGRLLDRV